MAVETPKTYLEQAIADGHVEISGEGKKERIYYLAADHSERWSDPEEKIRAEFWAELIYKYEYAPKLIKFEVKVPRRTPNDLADLVIYRDEECKDPYFVRNSITNHCTRPYAKLLLSSKINHGG